MYKNFKDTAEYLKISEQQLDLYIKTKKIKSYVVDGELLINSDQFDTFLQEKERLEMYAKYLKGLEIEESVDYKDED